DDAHVIQGISWSDMVAHMERGGMDRGMVYFGYNLILHYVYSYLPDPPVSPAAALSLSAAPSPNDGVDRISRLPDAVLRDIVSRLPAKDAARTAALASRWRPLWRSAPLTLADSHLLPDGGAGGQLVIGAASPRAVTAAVSRVLAAHPGPFRCVHLTRTTMEEHRGEMARWLDILAAKGVQELVFVNRPLPIDLRLPATIFSCASLTRLHLGIWRLPDTAAVPRAARFPNLRDLGLYWNSMEDRDLDFMLERSPVLESLFILGFQSGLRLRLVNQSLRCIQLGFSFAEDIDLVDAPRLERLFQFAELTESPKMNNGRSTRKRSSVIKIGSAPKLRVLGYLKPGEQELVDPTLICAGNKENIVPSVQILGIEVQFGVRNTVKKVPGFLRCFPNLETLHVQSRPISEESTGKVSVKFWQEGGPIKCILQSIKKVFFYEFRGSRSEVSFLKFVAEKARVLEQMVVVVCIECFSPGDDNVRVKLKPLTSAKWNSKACRLELFRSPVTDGSGPAYNHELASDFEFADPFDLKYYKKAGRISVS
uniref:F-box domain-containing protein n=1 Tax=Aegilops tauschii subsp. strangulata TaxID=200361 RepID=A0A453GHF2_AEGTS